MIKMYLQKVISRKTLYKKIFFCWRLGSLTKIAGSEYFRIQFFGFTALQIAGATKFPLKSIKNCSKGAYRDSVRRWIIFFEGLKNQTSTYFPNKAPMILKIFLASLMSRKVLFKFLIASMKSLTNYGYFAGSHLSIAGAGPARAPPPRRRRPAPRGAGGRK
jgi:hypothetical protein